MNSSEKPDAFSKALENKPRHSHINQIKKQFEENETVNYSNGPSVNRLSRVFESTQLETRPIPPTKPPSLRPNSISKPQEEPEIDQTQLSFKDIRARFQQQQQNPIPEQVY